MNLLIGPVADQTVGHFGVALAGFPVIITGRLAPDE
jgi:hypothetical protein